MTAEGESHEQYRQIGHDSDSARFDAGQIQTVFLVAHEPLDQNHYDDGHAKSRHAGSVRPGEQRRGAHAPHIVPSLPDAIGPEDNPTDGRQEEGQQHLPNLLQGRQKPPLRHRVPVFPVLADEDKRQEKDRMECAPGDERPVRPMPKTAHQEDHECVPDNLRLGAPATAQRNIHVIPEPGRQRDVPTTPELGDIPAEIREVEVPHRLEPEQLARADGHIRISGEIAINLEGEDNGRQQQCAAALRLVGRKDAVHIHRAVIGNHNLLEHTPQNLAHSVHARFIVEGPGLGQLLQQIRRPFNRARQELREESYISEILDNIMRRFQLSTINIDAITQRLECIEADANGQDDAKQKAIRLPAQEKIRERSGEKIIILEHAQNQQIHDDVQHIDRLRFPRRVPIFFYEHAAAITEQRRKGQQHQEPPVPPSIKDVGRHHDE